MHHESFIPEGEELAMLMQQFHEWERLHIHPLGVGDALEDFTELLTVVRRIESHGILFADWFIKELERVKYCTDEGV